MDGNTEADADKDKEDRSKATKVLLIFCGIIAFFSFSL